VAQNGRTGLEGTQLTFEAPAGDGTEDQRRTRPIRRITREDVMTAAEVAQLLALPKSTVYELARRGELPCARLGRTMRFLREDIEGRLRGR
jgi:excisionase family DNA binding protein